MASTDQQEPPQLSPLDELGKRFAEAGGGLKAAAAAVGLENHRALLMDHRKRLQDGHKAMANAIGAKVITDEPQDGDDMGGIMVTGDNHHHVTHHYPAAPAASPAPTSAAPATVTPTWAKWLAGAALAAGGGGAGFLVNALLNKPAAPPTAVNTTTNTTKGFLIDLMPSGPAKTPVQP